MSSRDEMRFLDRQIESLAELFNQHGRAHARRLSRTLGFEWRYFFLAVDARYVVTFSLERSFQRKHSPKAQLIRSGPSRMLQCIKIVS
jgi:hypothetical protein